MAIVELNGLTKFYGRHRGIEDLSFSIEEGEIFGFIGPNGSGKSTTIRTLLNYIYPSSGTAKIFGKDIVKNSKEIRKDIGYLPSEIYYYDDMKVKDILSYSAKFYHGDYSKRIIHLADRLSLDLSKKIEDLSFGNRKKVGIVQALLHKPKLLIFDEPTGGLDPLMQQIFFDLIQEEQQQGTTVFFSSHYLGEVQKMCKRVAIIKKGELIKVENVENLTKQQFKRVIIQVDEPALFTSQISGIKQKEITKHTISFLYSGVLKKLMEELANQPIKDLIIEDPSLEEIFMHYYENE